MTPPLFISFWYTRPFVSLHLPSSLNLSGTTSAFHRATATPWKKNCQTFARVAFVSGGSGIQSLCVGVGVWMFRCAVCSETSKEQPQPFSLLPLRASSHIFIQPSFSTHPFARWSRSHTNPTDAKQTHKTTWGNWRQSTTSVPVTTKKERKQVHREIQRMQWIPRNQPVRRRSRKHRKMKQQIETPEERELDVSAQHSHPPRSDSQYHSRSTRGGR